MAHGKFRGSNTNAERKAWDPYVYAQTTINTPHRMIHDGFMFSCGGKITGWLTATTQDLWFLTGTKPVHFQGIDFQFGRGDIDIDTRVGATVSANGTLVSSLNHDLGNAQTSLAALYTGPTVTGAGTVGTTYWVPPTAAGVGATGTGIVDRTTPDREYVLEPSTGYLLRMTNNSGATISAGFEATWYEVDY